MKGVAQVCSVKRLVVHVLNNSMEHEGRGAGVQCSEADCANFNCMERNVEAGHSQF